MDDTYSTNDNIENTRAVQKETWREVFQIVSDHPDWFTREAIKALEAARGLAGAGPN
jgi:hypothetical protein